MRTTNHNHQHAPGIFKNFAQNARIVTLFSVATGDEIYAINTHARARARACVCVYIYTHAHIYIHTHTSIYHTYTYVYMRPDQIVPYDYTAEDFSGHVWTCFWMS